jgi:hypothetical protein
MRSTVIYPGASQGADRQFCSFRVAVAHLLTKRIEQFLSQESGPISFRQEQSTFTPVRAGAQMLPLMAGIRPFLLPLMNGIWYR